MPSYSLNLEGPDGVTYVPSHDLPDEMREVAPSATAGPLGKS